MQSLSILILWIIILLFNAFYRFLPQAIQKNKWIKTLAVIVAVIISIYGTKQAIHEYRNYRFAYICARDGKILKMKNFPWDITKTITHEGNVIYCINERYGDASEVSIKPDKTINEYSIHNGGDGIIIKFTCPDKEIPNFKIQMK